MFWLLVGLGVLLLTCVVSLAVAWRAERKHPLSTASKLKLLRQPDFDLVDVPVDDENRFVQRFALFDSDGDGDPEVFELVEVDGHPLSLNDLIHKRLSDHYAISTPHSINDLLSRWRADNP